VTRCVNRRARPIIDDSHRTVTALLTEHRDQLEVLALALLKAETLDMADAYAAAILPAHVAIEEPPRASGASGTLSVARH